MTRDAYELHQGLIERLTSERVLEGTSSRRHFTPFLIPVGGPIRRTGTAGMLVAGDAGGFVNGFSAEGIDYAMVSGDLAAVSVAEMLARRQPANVSSAIGGPPKSAPNSPNQWSSNDCCSKTAAG